jgi:hypothetical protein
MTEERIAKLEKQVAEMRETIDCLLRVRFRGPSVETDDDRWLQRETCRAVDRLDEKETAAVAREWRNAHPDRH